MRRRRKRLSIRQLQESINAIDSVLNECDGSCLINQRLSEEYRCEDGEILRIYFCSHEKIYILTTYAPIPEIKDTDFI